VYRLSNIGARTEPCARPFFWDLLSFPLLTRKRQFLSKSSASWTNQYGMFWSVRQVDRCAKWCVIGCCKVQEDGSGLQVLLIPIFYEGCQGRDLVTGAAVFAETGLV